MVRINLLKPPLPNPHHSPFSLTHTAAMELLSFSKSPSSYPQSSPNFKPHRPIFLKPQSLSLRCPNNSSFKCSISSPQISGKTLNSGGLGFEFDQPNLSVLLSSAPQSPERAARGAASDVMGLMLRERIVFLGCEINDIVADSIVSQLLLLDAQDPTKEIRLFINSPGGSLSDTMAIYDVLKLVRADVSTIALGISASTASIVLGGGTKGKRFAMPNTRIMIHQPMGGFNGSANRVEIQAEELLYSRNAVATLLSDSTGRSFEQVEKDIDKDRYMSPIEAVEYGLIDWVIDRDSILPLEPVPENVEESEKLKKVWEEVPEKLIYPEVPDDEIY